MSTDPTIEQLTTRLAELEARLGRQNQELAALRGRADRTPPDPRFGRRHLLGALAGLGAAGAAGVATARPAAAADGDPVLLGQENSSDTATYWHTSDECALEIEGDGFCVILAGGYFEQPTYGVISTGSAAGVLGYSETGAGLSGETSAVSVPAITALHTTGGPALGGLSDGGGPQLWLESLDADPAGPPGQGQRGFVKFDVNGDVWICIANGDHWTRLLREDTTAGRVITISPFRALDTRATGGRPAGSPAVPGQKKGPLHGGEAITLDLAGVADIPAGSRGVVGNLTVVAPTGTGFLRAYAAGTSTTTSAVNFDAGGNTANAFTSAINPTGLRLVAPISSSITYHLVVDITAYIT